MEQYQEYKYDKEKDELWRDDKENNGINLEPEEGKQNSDKEN